MVRRMDRFAEFLTAFLLRKKYIPAEEKEIYCYGFKLITADVINFSIVILIGILINRLADSIIFLGVLCGLRQFCGGFHARTFWLCRLSMVLTYISSEFLSSGISNLHIESPAVIILNIITVTIMALFAPVENVNKFLSEQEKKVNKLIAVITSACLAIISVILIVVGIDKGVNISVTMFAAAILMLVPTSFGRR